MTLNTVETPMKLFNFNTAFTMLSVSRTSVCSISFLRRSVYNTFGLQKKSINQSIDQSIKNETL